MEQFDVTHRVDTPDGPRMVQERETRRWFSPGRVIGFLSGVLLSVVGFIAVLDAGINSNLTIPQIEVFGMRQSAATGLTELVLGLLIMISAAYEDTRPLMGVFGAVALIGGLMAGVASPEIQANVGFDHDAGWFVAFCGLVAIVGALLPAVWTEHRSVSESEPPFA